MLFYCSPAAGVLALELRRCTIKGIPLPSPVSRADVIRNLSVLTSCLEWIVLPGDGNRKLCNELNKMLALVLDEVLNYEPRTNGVQTNEDDAGAGNSGATLMAGAGQGFFDMPMIEGLEPIPTEAEEFLNWLDNATWKNTASSIIIICEYGLANDYPGLVLNTCYESADHHHRRFFELHKITCIPIIRHRCASLPFQANQTAIFKRAKRS